MKWKLMINAKDLKNEVDKGKELIQGSCGESRAKNRKGKCGNCKWKGKGVGWGSRESMDVERVRVGKG